MRLLHINTMDQKGGAATVAWSLIRSAAGRGYEARMAARDILSNNPLVTPLRKSISGDNSLSSLSKVLSGKDLFSYSHYRFRDAKGFLRSLLADDINYGKNNKKLIELCAWADIIHCHNLHGDYFDLKLLIELSRKKPVVWTLHDMWSITGHCAHSFGCERWQTGCGRCPYLKTYPALLWDRTHDLWERKKAIYDKSRLTIVAPSKWLRNKVRGSTFKNHNIRLIYNGIDTDMYCPIEKITARTDLGLPLEKKIILFMASGGKSNSWKGWGYFNQVAGKYRNKNDYIFLCIGGKGREKKENRNIFFVDYINDRNTIVKYYNTADIFLFPSIAENFPLEVLEAMSCGTPIVGFDVGGVKEVLTHKENGYLARYKDFDDLIVGIKYIISLSIEDLAIMSQKSREKIVNNFSSEKMVDEYMRLYDKMLENYFFRR